MRLESVGKRYGLTQPWIVRDVSLDVPAGQLIRLEGRNGSGKSTLLRVLAGACLPSAGRVTCRPVTGYVPERFPPGLPFSARDYLLHLGRISGLRGAGLARRVDECLDRLGAADYAAAPMRTLSKGMCQKVAVARALLPRPGLLVLDEAWTGLDTAAQGVLDDAVALRLADGAAVVFVDHDPQRLSGLPAQRWQVAGGQLVPASAPAAVPAAAVPAAAVPAAAVPGAAVPGAGAPGAPSAPGAGPAVVIEVTGLRADAAARVPGVRSVRAAGERLVLDAEPGQSDAVLRLLLAGGGSAVHVLSVRQVPAGGLSGGGLSGGGLSGGGLSGGGPGPGGQPAAGERPAGAPPAGPPSVAEGP